MKTVVVPLLSDWLTVIWVVALLYCSNAPISCSLIGGISTNFVLFSIEFIALTSLGQHSAIVCVCTAHVSVTETERNIEIVSQKGVQHRKLYLYISTLLHLLSLEPDSIRFGFKRLTHTHRGCNNHTSNQKTKSKKEWRKKITWKINTSTIVSLTKEMK